MLGQPKKTRTFTKWKNKMVGSLVWTLQAKKSVPIKERYSQKPGPN